MGTEDRLDIRIKVDGYEGMRRYRQRPIQDDTLRRLKGTIVMKRGIIILLL